MSKLLNWFRRDKLENGLDRELKYHIDRRVNDLIQFGIAEAEARSPTTCASRSVGSCAVPHSLRPRLSRSRSASAPPPQSIRLSIK